MSFSPPYHRSPRHILRYPVRSALAVIVILTAQTIPAFGQTEYRVKHMTTDNGLPHSILYSLLIDSRGFIWAGTRDGLVRYDGYTFTTLWSGTTPLHILEEDAAGNIWAGTPQALYRIDRKTGRSTTFVHDPNDSTSLSDSWVSMVLRTRDGTLWIGTRSGLCRYDPTQQNFRRIHLSDTGAVSVEALLEDNEGNLWLQGMLRTEERSCKQAVLCCLPNGCDSAERIRIPAAISTQFPAPVRMFLDAYGDVCALYVACHRTADYMLVQGAPETLTPRNVLVRSETPGTIAELSHRIKSRNGRLTEQLTLGTSNTVEGERGLYLAELKYNGEQIVTEFDLIYPPGVSKSMQGIREDGSGLLWVCSDDGLFKVIPSTFFFPPSIRIESPSDAAYMQQRVRDIHRDANGDLWVGLDGRLLRFGAEDGQRDDLSDQVDLNSGLSEGAANAFFEIADRLYIGVNHQLYEYDLQRRTFRQTPVDVPTPQIRAIERDSTGTLWFGAIGSLIRWKPGSSPQHDILETRTGFLSSAIWSLKYDHRHRMWAGTQNSLLRWDHPGSQPLRYEFSEHDSSSLPQGPIWSILEDSLQRLWVGVYGGGLALYRPSSDDFLTFTARDGLPSNSICAVIEDNEGNIWISSSNGLARCTFESVPFTDSVILKQVQTYTTADGLIGNEFALKAAWCDPDGTLYFGGSNHIARFDPTRLRKNTNIPALAVTSFRANDSLISIELLDGDEVTLDHTLNHLEFEFAALDYLNPQGNLYAYKLEGIDRTWNYSGNRRYASYSGVAPGTYELHIRGANSHGTWNNTGIRIRIRITPPLWATFWFRGLVLAAVCGIGLTWYGNRRARRQEREERRVIEAKLQALRLQMKPHFIFNSLNSIHGFILLHKSKEAGAYLSKFSRLMRIALYHSRSSFISLRDELRFLELYLELEALRFDHSFSCDIRVDVSASQDSIQLPSMLVQPYVENAIHHGLRSRDSGRLQIIFETPEPGQLRCTIEDNGIGRAAARAMQSRRDDHQPIGTSVTGQRLELLNSFLKKKFSVEIVDMYDSDGTAAGTRVILSISLPHVNDMV